MHNIFSYMPWHYCYWRLFCGGPQRCELTRWIFSVWFHDELKILFHYISGLINSEDRKCICLTGIWRTTLKPMEAGGPYILTAYQSTTNTSIVLKDVLFGDIWLCSGQSNMAFTVGQVSKFLLTSNVTVGTFSLPLWIEIAKRKCGLWKCLFCKNANIYFPEENTFMAAPKYRKYYLAVNVCLMPPFIKYND